MAEDALLDDIDHYWEMVERKQERAQVFLDEPSRETFADLIDKKHFWATRARGSTDHYLENFVFVDDQTPERLAETIQEVLDTGNVELLVRQPGFGWATATEILHALNPDQFAILNTRSMRGLEALGFDAPDKNTASQEEYDRFVETIRNATTRVDFSGIVQEVTEAAIPEWTTSLTVADFAFSLHHQGKCDLAELEPDSVPSVSLADIGDQNAAYYWVNQRNQEEINEEYLKAKVDDVWHHDLSKLDEGDVVFHNFDGELIGVSTVIASADTYTSSGAEYYRVQIDFHQFDKPQPVNHEFREALGREEFHTEKYYPLDKNDYLNEAYLTSLSPQAAEYILSQVTTDTELGETRYYRLNTNVEDWQEPGGEIFARARSSEGNKSTSYQWFEKASPGDQVIIYQMGEKKRIVGQGHVKRGLHRGYHEYRDEETEGITVVWDESIDGPTWDFMKSDPILRESKMVKSGNSLYLCPLTEKEFNRILDLSSGSVYNDHVDSLAVPESDITVEQGDLHFSEAEWQRIERRIRQALSNGNHVLLFGPPGTGKTKLARQVCEATVGKHNYELVTASADWSTFDTVGGYQTTSANRLKFEPGVVLDRFQADSDGTPKNEWLVIDELNRADIDKAFGSLFSALTGESVTLPFDDSDGTPIEIIDSSRTEELVAPNRYYIPEDWQMLATMNTLDKTSLYEMSYAFMRRWAFIPVGIPELPEPGVGPDGEQSELAALVESYVDVWTSAGDISYNDAHFEQIGRIWHAINQERSIGPAIVEDLYRYVASDPTPRDADYVSPIIMYVYPQLEGLRRTELQHLLSTLDEIIDDEQDELWTVARDYFQMDLRPASED